MVHILFQACFTRLSIPSYGDQAYIGGGDGKVKPTCTSLNAALDKRPLSDHTMSNKVSIERECEKHKPRFVIS